MWFKERHQHRNKCIKVDHYNDVSYGDKVASVEATWICIDCGHLSQSTHYGAGWITKRALNVYEQDDLDGYLEGSYGYLIDSFLQDLVNKGYLPEGEYVIK